MPKLTELQSDAAALGWIANAEPYSELADFSDGVPKSLEYGQQYHIPGIIEKRQFTTADQQKTECDWRTHLNLMQVENQNPLQACMAYAIGAVLDARQQIRGGPPLRTAPRYFHLNDLKLPGILPTGMGDCAELCELVGFPQWVKGADSLTTLADCAALPPPKRLKIVGAFSFDDVEQVKREISTRGPVVCSMITYEDFRSYYRSGIYRPTAKNLPVRHAMAIVGYINTKQCWILKNSFGSKWGEQGYCHYDIGATGMLGETPNVWAIDLA